MSRSRRATSSWVAPMRLRVSIHARTAIAAARRTAISARTPTREGRGRPAGGAAPSGAVSFSVMGKECYQPLDHLVVGGAGHQHLAHAGARRTLGDARVRHEERRL